MVYKRRPHFIEIRGEASVIQWVIWIDCFLSWVFRLLWILLITAYLHPS